MSYTPKNQDIETPIEKIKKGIEEFVEAADERIKSGDWDDNHNDKLISLIKEVTDLKYKLYNWF